MTQTSEQEPTLREILNKIDKQQEKWDERFFQLSQDTLNFSRDVIVTAAVVAVLAPVLKESLLFALDLLKRQ
jgi:MerR family transcriptional regulator, repressor of the yfmOP operon